MFRPISHMAGVPQMTPSRAGEAVLKWAFTDDEGHRWSGLCTVEPCAFEPCAKESAHFVTTFKLARVGGQERVRGR